MSKDLLAILNRFTAPLAQSIKLMLRRCKLTRINDCKPVQTLQVKGFKNECREGVERIQEYGFSSVPLADSEGILLFLGGEGTHPVVVATNDRRFRPKGLSPGDVIIYTDQNPDKEHHIYLNSINRLIKIRANDIHLETEGNITCKCNEMLVDAKTLKCTGEIEDHTRTMQADRDLYNAHGHPDASPPPTAKQ